MQFNFSKFTFSAQESVSRRLNLRTVTKTKNLLFIQIFWLLDWRFVGRKTLAGNQNLCTPVHTSFFRGKKVKHHQNSRKQSPLPGPCCRWNFRAPCQPLGQTTRKYLECLYLLKLLLAGKGESILQCKSQAWKIKFVMACLLNCGYRVQRWCSLL